MKTLQVTIKSAAPMSMSRYHDTEKLPKEQPDDYEKRTWREKMHCDSDENVVITPFMLKNCITNAAKFISMPIKGKGKSTYTKHILSGILILEGIVLPVKKYSVPPQWMFVSSNGIPGGGTRVKKAFPLIQKWGGTFNILVLDELLTKDVLVEHLEAAGMFVGIGSLRVGNGGIFGRFQVVDADWIE
jgi:hypothetical protein